MARPCTICASQHRHALDSAVSRGTSQAVAAQRFGFTQSSVSRHVSRHLGNAIGGFSLEKARAGIHDQDLLDTLIQQLNGVRAVAASAHAAGRPSLALQAAGSVRELTKTIREISGSAEDPAELLEMVADGVRLAESVAVVVRRNPEFGILLAAEFDGRDDEMAEQLRTLAERSQKSLALNRKDS